MSRFSTRVQAQGGLVLLETKLYPPRTRRELVRRPRLFEALVHASASTAPNGRLQTFASRRPRSPA